MRRIGSTVWSIINTALLALANSSHLIFTLWITVEQIKTGWGFGTGIEIFALLPIATQIVCAPTILSAILFLLLPSRRRTFRALSIAVAALLFSLLAQYGIFWLFLCY